MLNRLLDTVNEFTELYDIHINSHIFTHTLFKLAGIEANYCLTSESHKYAPVSQDCIKFYCPNMHEDDFNKLCKYLDNAQTHQPLPIYEDVMFQKVVPEFKAYIKKLAKENSAALKSYQELSREYLSPRLTTNLYMHAEGMLDTLDSPSDTYHIPNENANANELRSELNKCLKTIKSRPSQYATYLETIKSEMHALTIIVKNIVVYDFNNARLEDDIEKLKNHFDFYVSETKILIDKLSIAKHNRSKTRELYTSLDTILNKYYISAKHCHVFVDGMLHLADIKIQPSTCNWFNEYPRSVFSIYGLSEDNANKFLQFFKINGDKDATSIKAYELNTSARKDITNICYQFFVSHEILANTMLPKFKNLIENDWALNATKRLQQYQKKSQSGFPNHKLPNSIISLFTKSRDKASAKSIRTRALLTR